AEVVEEEEEGLGRREPRGICSASGGEPVGVVEPEVLGDLPFRVGVLGSSVRGASFAETAVGEGGETAMMTGGVGG
ncbi:hypothetical protein, partial [Aetokthonos hydrillicola]|uniref:hypothetical protein n=1 Tax=Aetokthonos hydrillicola TaxID=1550245 RepID=UPI001ABADC00